MLGKPGPGMVLVSMRTDDDRPSRPSSTPPTTPTLKASPRPTGSPPRSRVSLSQTGEGSGFNSQTFGSAYQISRPTQPTTGGQQRIRRKHVGWDYSGLMLAARMTLPHFSVSSATNFSHSAGVIGSGSAPKSASRAFNVGSARAALISLLSFSTISAGVFLGEATPYGVLA